MSDELQLLPLLTVARGPLQGASFRLRPGLCRIGREDGVEVVLDDPKVSRRHATLELADGRVLLADSGSTNGTWLNDRRVCETAELRDGDRIRLGHVELRFFDPGTALTDPVGAFRYRAPTPSPADPPLPVPGPTPPPAGPTPPPADSGTAPDDSGAAAPGSPAPAPAVDSPPVVPGSVPLMVGSAPVVAGSPAVAVGALVEPTQLIGTPRRPGRSRRMLLMVGGSVVLAGWVAWVAYLAVQ